MTSRSPLRVLFTGYAPVHFVCFMPLYERLRAMPEVEVSLSGGLRTKTKSGLVHDEAAMYAPFAIDRGSIIPVDRLSDLSFDVLFAANTKMIAPGRVDARVQIFHGISFRNKAVRGENMSADHYFMVGPYMRRKFVESGLMAEDDARALSIGFMKTDRLLNGTLDRSALLARFGFDGSRAVLLYAPTGQKDNSLETMGEAVIERIAASGEYDLIIKPHDHPKNTKINWFQRLERFCGPHLCVTRDLDVVPLLFMADLLITDASSVSSEYALLDRPIVFLDVPKLLERAQMDADSQIDLDSWGRHTGEIVKTPEAGLAAIGDSLANPARFAALRQGMAKDLFFNRGAATDKAAEWFRTTFVGNRTARTSTKPNANYLPGRLPVAPRIKFEAPIHQRAAAGAVAHDKTKPGGESK